MYSLNIPVAKLRNKMRQEFERHRYVNQIGVVDVLLFQSHTEFQVSPDLIESWEIMNRGLEAVTARRYSIAALRLML